MAKSFNFDLVKIQKLMRDNYKIPLYISILTQILIFIFLVILLLYLGDVRNNKEHREDRLLYITIGGWVSLSISLFAIVFLLICIFNI